MNREDKAGEGLSERTAKAEMEMELERRRIEEGLRENNLILGFERDRVLGVRDERAREVAEAVMASEFRDKVGGASMKRSYVFIADFFSPHFLRNRIFLENLL